MDRGVRRPWGHKELDTTEATQHTTRDESDSRKGSGQLCLYLPGLVISDEVAFDNMEITDDLDQRVLSGELTKEWEEKKEIGREQNGNCLSKFAAKGRKEIL